MTTTVPHQALYRRWRAQRFAEIVGQTAVVETLRNAVRQDRVAHAILFVGPRGTGKTSLARILAKALNCTNLQDGDPCDACPSCTAIRDGRALDLVEIDAASNRGIDAIRELRERIQYAPTDLRRKVYILDEAHQITKDAWNALLKSLEEPPDFVVFMFASTHPQEFPPAILSRLQRYDVRRLTVAEIDGKLKRILEADGRSAEPAAVGLIARLAAGGMRDAESMLDQLLASGADPITEAAVRDLLGLAEAEAVEAFADALVAGDPAAGMAVLDRLDERGRDARVLLEQAAEALRSRLVEALTAGATPQAAAAIAGAARRLATIDPTRHGVGGLRLQLELALFPDPSTATVAPGSVVPASALPVSQAEPKRTVLKPEPEPDPGAERRRPPAQPTRDADESVTAPAPDPIPAPPRLEAREARVAAAATGPGEPAPLTDGPEAPPPPSGDVELLRGRWPEIVARISQHPPTKPLIAACRPISVEGNVVTLGFPEDQAFLRDVADRRRPILEQGMAEFLGRSVAVRVVATNLDLIPAPAGADGGALFEEARRIFADELVDVGEVS